MQEITKSIDVEKEKQKSFTHKIIKQDTGEECMMKVTFDELEKPLEMFITNNKGRIIEYADIAKLNELGLKEKSSEEKIVEIAFDILNKERAKQGGVGPLKL